MASSLNELKKLFRSRRIKFGLPLVCFVVGGSFALEQFAKVRYEFRKVNPYSIPDNDDLISYVKPEEEVEKLKELDLDSWDNKRVPRPWEPDNQSHQSKI